MKIILSAFLCSLIASTSHSLEIKKSVAEESKIQARVKCAKFDYSSSQDKCRNLVNQGKYFQEIAFDYCMARDFNKDRLECLSMIKNRKYRDVELKACKKAPYSSGQKKCIADSGTFVIIVDKEDELEKKHKRSKRFKKDLREAKEKMYERLNRIQSLLQTGKIQKAKKLIKRWKADYQ